MTATIQVQRTLFYKHKEYRSCVSVCNVKLGDVDQVLNVPLSVKNIRRVLLQMGYDKIEVSINKTYQTMDNFAHVAKLKEVKERKAFIEANPGFSNQELAKKYGVTEDTIRKDKKAIANRKEFE